MRKLLISVKIQNIMDIKKVFLQWFITFLKKKSKGVAVACAWSKTLATCGKDAIKIKNRLNQQLSEELHKPVKLVWRC